MEGKPVTELDPIYFLVQLSHGAPISDEFNILRVYDFPIENRKQKVSLADWKGYINKHKWDDRKTKFSDFHFLLYMMREFDPDTILSIGASIGKEEAVDEGCVELIESM